MIFLNIAMHRLEGSDSRYLRRRACRAVESKPFLIREGFGIALVK